MKLKVNQGFLSYDLVGQGTPLLFIHGYPLSRKIWEAQLSGLSDIATIISLDLRGHGESYPFEPPYSMDMLADDCKLLLDSLGITERIVVCGLSMGGYVTFALYRKVPDIFKGMILASTRAAADSPDGKANRDTAVNNVYAHGVAFVVDAMLPKTVSPATLSSNLTLVNSIRNIMLETSVNGVVGASQAMRGRADSTPLLSQIHIPVLLVHGADDQIIPVSEAEAMHKHIQGSKLVVVPGAGHLSNMEQPEIFNRAVRDYLNSLG